MHTTGTLDPHRTHERPTLPRSPTLGWIVAAAMLFLLAAPPTGGEEVDRTAVLGGLTFIDQVQVTVMNIDVFVRDEQGRPVTGLRKEDFRLLVNGSERPISHFAAIREELLRGTPESAPEAPAAATPVASDDETPSSPSEAQVGALVQPVYVVLYVDNENLRPHDRNRVLSQARRFISEIMKPHVRVSVIAAQRSTEIVQEFTDDPSAVRNALRSMDRDYGARVDHDRLRGRLIHDLQEAESRGTSQMSATEARSLQERIRVYGEELTTELEYSIASLREVLTTLGGLEGRKILVHVTSGLPAVPARDLVEWYGDLFQNSSTLPMLARFNRRASIEALASAANAQGVAFYTIDASGLGGQAGSSAEYARPVDPMVAGVHDINLREPLLVLADSTGGRCIVDSNDITGLLEELRDDLFTYYSLGHALPTTGADTVHRVEVSIPGRPELKLVYRRTMVEKSLETQVQDRVVSGLLLALDHNPMGIGLEAGTPTVATEDRWIVPVEISIPLSSVAMLPEGDELVGRIVLFVANRDIKGRQSDMQRRLFDIRMPPEEYESRKIERYVAEFDLLLNPGEHRIVIGVLDPVTRQASFAKLDRRLVTGG